MEEDDEDTEMVDPGTLVDVNRSYAEMVADPSQRSKHAPQESMNPTGTLLHHA